MLEASGFKVTIGGNIGAPLSAQVAQSTPDTLHVIETSSFQLEQIATFRPWIAVMLNFSPDHLDRHPSVGVRGRQGADLRAPEADAWSVNAADPLVLELARHGAARRRLFARDAALEEGTAISDGWIVSRHDGRIERLVPLDTIHLIGPHLVVDVIAAATVGTLAGAAPAAMTAAVDAFPGLEHAMELVAECRGVRFVNDSKATNVESALGSIESFASDRCRFSEGDSGWRPAAASAARSPLVPGLSSPSARHGLVRDALHDVVDVHEADSLEAAVRLGFDLASPAGVVLLAPACASFDMFRDYAERGRTFKEEVARLVRERRA
jgi:UDP-N-acetylmuramoylalanine--D-glutamate ligase